MGRLRGMTWRTRMSRVRCWRCELEARKEKGWELFRTALGWTCFCRFRGYELDEEEEERREVEREGERRRMEREREWEAQRGSGLGLGALRRGEFGTGRGATF